MRSSAAGSDGATSRKSSRRSRKVEAAIAPIYDVEQIFADPQYNARQSITTVPDEDLGPVKMQNVFPKLSRTPGRIRFAGTRIDQHREEILADLRAAGRLRPGSNETPKR